MRSTLIHRYRRTPSELPGSLEPYCYKDRNDWVLDPVAVLAVQAQYAYRDFTMFCSIYQRSLYFGQETQVVVLLRWC